MVVNYIYRNKLDGYWQTERIVTINFKFKILLMEIKHFFLTSCFLQKKFLKEIFTRNDIFRRDVFITHVFKEIPRQGTGISETISYITVKWSKKYYSKSVINLNILYNNFFFFKYLQSQDLIWPDCFASIET